MVRILFFWLFLNIVPLNDYTVSQTVLVLDGVFGLLLLTSCLCYVASYHSSSEKLKLTEELLSLSPQHVAAAYALNPLTIATCIAMSTGVFHNFILSLVLFFILRGTFITFSVIISRHLCHHWHTCRWHGIWICATVFIYCHIHWKSCFANF